MSDNTHDKRSPSQLKRRMICPGSYQMELAYEKVTGKELKGAVSSDASRGIVLHSLIKRIVEGEESFVVGDIVEASGQSYVLVPDDIFDIEFVVNEVLSELGLLEEGDEAFWEQQVDLSKYGIEAKDGNLVDLLIYKKNGELTIIEFKFGAYYVDEPRFNLQVGAYAVGAEDSFGKSPGVTAIILQPKAFSHEYRRRDYTFTHEEVEGLRQRIKQVIDATDNKDAPIAKGDHCIFCPMRMMCPLHRDAYLNIPTYMEPGEFFLSQDKHERGQVYTNMLAAQAWLKIAIEECDELILGGCEVDGYEIGEGRKSRGWNIDDAEFMARFPACIQSKPMTPSAVEKVVGKREFANTYKDLEDVKPGAPKVVKSRKKK